MKAILRKFSGLVGEQIFGAIFLVLSIIGFVYFALKKDYQDLDDNHIVGKIAHKFGNVPAKIFMLLLMGLLMYACIMLVFNK